MWLLSNKTLVKDSGLLEGFCDYHCHLLPGVDDGVQDIKESLAILNLWEKVGVRDVWLTPHIMDDIPNEPKELEIKFDNLKSEYEGSIQLHLAAENMIDNLFLQRLNEQNLLSINNRKNPLLLIETSYYNPPIGMDTIIGRIKEQGYTPLLAHPERYQYMDLEDFQKWKHTGMMFQLNLFSLLGAYGPIVKKKAEILVNRGLYNLCGTDTHSLSLVEDFLYCKIENKYLKAMKQLIQNN